MKTFRLFIPLIGNDLEKKIQIVLLFHNCESLTSERRAGPHLVDARSLPIVGMTIQDATPEKMKTMSHVIRVDK